MKRKRSQKRILKLPKQPRSKKERVPNNLPPRVAKFVKDNFGPGAWKLISHIIYPLANENGKDENDAERRGGGP